MTREDKARKRDARRLAAETGISYSNALWQLRQQAADGAPILARDLRARLTESLQAAGWPVEAGDGFENAQYDIFAGPVHLTVGRADQLASLSGDEDPDDDDLVDLTVPPEVVLFAPPVIDGRGDQYVEQLAGDLPAAQLTRRLAEILEHARGECLARTVADQECGICQDYYPAAHLLTPTASASLKVCPACAYDEDLPEGITARLAFELDRMFFADLAYPAGWTAVAALLACAARPRLADRLQRQWKQAGLVHAPLGHWSDPGSLWVWLPPRDRRPPALAALGPGARLSHLVAVLDSAFPSLREQVRQEQREAWLEAGGAEDEEPDDIPDKFIEAMWPVCVAYGVAFTTQASERPAHRSPLHVSESLADLDDHWEQIDSPFDIDDALSTVQAGMEAVAHALTSSANHDSVAGSVWDARSARRLSAAPTDTETLTQWVDRIAGELALGRRQTMERLGLQPGNAPVRRLRELSAAMTEGALHQIATATGLTADQITAMAQRSKPAADHLADMITRAVERTPADDDLPSGWSFMIPADTVARLGGTAKVRAAARAAAQRLGWSVMTHVYPSASGQPAQAVGVISERRSPLKRPAAPSAMPARPSGTLGEPPCLCTRGPCAVAGNARRAPVSTADNSAKEDAITLATDLRTLPARMRSLYNASALFAPTRPQEHFADSSRYLDLDLLRMGAPLGPLADVHVYCTDPHGRYHGKAHGLGCQHAREIGPRHIVLPFGEFLTLLPSSDLAMFDPDWRTDRWCTGCGGYAIRRLGPSQCAFYQDLVRRASTGG
jgi:hypothetical protein